MKKLLVSTFLLIFLVSACAPAVIATSASTEAIASTSAPEPTQVVEPTAVTSASLSALFRIAKPDGAKFDVTLDAVKGLPLVSITVDGKVQEGPKLLDILSLAGITEFTEVTISGSSAPCTLTRDQVDDNTILDFSNRGTMKLATTYIPKANWTKDITEIIVK